MLFVTYIFIVMYFVEKKKNCRGKFFGLSLKNAIQ